MINYSKEPKTDKFYILYDENDFFVQYFDTLKEFSCKYKRNYNHLKSAFSNKKFIRLLICCKHYFLYKFSDKELECITI